MMKLSCLNILFFLFIIVNSVNAHTDAQEQADFLVRVNNIFSEIRGEYNFQGNVSFAFKEIEVGSAEAKRYPFKGCVIILYPDKIENIADYQLKGLLAHEMAHLESYSGMNWVQLGFFALRYSISSDFQKEVERETDMKAIEKGFGKELLDYREYRLETGSNRDKNVIKENYLSPEEIKRIIG